MQASYETGGAGTGRITVTATGPDGSDTGFFDIAVVLPIPGVPTVDISVNPPLRLDRPACVTVGAGPAGAFQCGELLLVHSMPAFRSLNRERSLTLVYNSATARPYPIVMADVSLAPEVATPDSLRVTLSIDSPAVSWTYLYDSAGLVSGGDARRLAIGFDAAATGLTTGVHAYTLEIVSVYDTANHQASASGELIVVDRRASPYGAGWAVAGVERLFTGQRNGALLLVDGDGSAVVYEAIGTDTWLAVPGAYRDTLRREAITGDSELPNGTYFWRRLRDRTRIYYDEAGRQVLVRDRVAHTARYTYRDATPDAPLATIRIAPRDANLVYTFVYDSSGRLDKITDPAGRELDVTVDSSGRLTAFLDPGMEASQEVELDYDSLLRLVSWRSRRGHTTKYDYVGTTATLAVVTLPETQAGRAVTNFTPAQVQGLALSGSGLNATVSAPSAFVVVDGPRPASDVLDIMRFRVNAFGAPTMTLNALGDSTNIAYGDARFPLLPTRVRFANDRVVGMAYDDASNLLWQADSTHSAGVATESFQYDTRWNRVRVAKRPEGDSIAYEYDSQTGNLIKITDAQGNETAVRWYTSGSSLGLVKAVDEPGSEPADSFAYNTAGNLVLVRDGRGHLWHYDYDDYGNLNFMEDPTGLKTRIVFTPLNLDTLTLTFSDTVADTIKVRKAYDADGHMTDLWDPINLHYQWLYDEVGLVSKKIDAAGAADSFRYDLAGNLKEHYTRRGHTITHTYDALNQLKTRTLPAFSDTVRLLGELSVPGDLEYFEYDEVGSITFAMNGAATVVREYNPEGTIKTETQKLVRWGEPGTTGHEYTWTFEYDRNSRLKKIVHPSGVSPISAGKSTVYRYGKPGDPDPRGLLVELTPPDGPAIDVSHDARGRRERIDYPNGVVATFKYEGDNSLWGVTYVNAAGGTIASDSIVRDAVGNVLERWRGVNGSPRLIETTYDPFHRLESFDHGLTGAWGAYLYDAAGNRKVSVLGDASGQFPATREYDYLNGRLSAVLLPSLSGTELLQAWNADGSLKARYGVSGYATQGHDPTRGTITVWRWAVREDDYVYHAAGKLIRTASFDTTLTPTRREAQYRYDALGRRVLVWNQGGGASGSQRVYRYLYVGDHVAYILPSTSNLNLTDANQVEGYLVDPVTGHTLKHWNNAERHRYHHRDEQGTLLYITNENGGPEYMAEQGYDPFGIPLGGPRTHITTELTPDAYLGRDQDTGLRGLVYLRNRYYDPYTGRFTQEDPIGFAGGINLYAYAGNNPASYTDPFGLCPDEDPECAALEAAYAATGAAIGFWLGGGAGAIEALATGGTLAPAIALQASAASGVGAALGGLVGNVVYFAKSSTSGNSPAAQSGRARHAAYSQEMAAQGYNTNKALPGSRLRPDAWSESKGIVRELKPNTPTGIDRGMRQLAKYKEAAERAWGKVVKTFLDLYNP